MPEPVGGRLAIGAPVAGRSHQGAHGARGFDGQPALPGGDEGRGGDAEGQGGAGVESCEGRSRVKERTAVTGTEGGARQGQGAEPGRGRGRSRAGTGGGAVWRGREREGEGCGGGGTEREVRAGPVGRSKWGRGVTDGGSVGKMGLRQAMCNSQTGKNGAGY